MPRKPRISAEKLRDITDTLQHAHKMLSRVKSGHPAHDSHIDGDGPVNEFYAIGAARASLRTALQGLGVDVEGAQ